MPTQDVELVGIVLRRAAGDIPPIGMPSDHAQGFALPAAADHDRRERVRAWGTKGILDAVVGPSKGGRRFGPQPFDDLYRFVQLSDPDASLFKREVVGPVLFLHPARPNAK